MESKDFDSSLKGVEGGLTRRGFLRLGAVSGLAVVFGNACAGVQKMPDGISEASEADQRLLDIQIDIAQRYPGIDRDLDLTSLSKEQLMMLMIGINDEIRKMSLVREDYVRKNPDLTEDIDTIFVKKFIQYNGILKVVEFQIRRCEGKMLDGESEFI